MKIILLIVILCISSITSPAEEQPYISGGIWNANDEFVIEKSIQSKIFYINGRKFKAKRTCKYYEAGQIVQFTESDPKTCFENTLYNQSTGTECSVYCVQVNR